MHDENDEMVARRTTADVLAGERSALVEQMKTELTPNELKEVDEEYPERILSYIRCNKSAMLRGCASFCVFNSRSQELAMLMAVLVMETLKCRDRLTVSIVDNDPDPGFTQRRFMVTLLISGWAK